MSLETESEIAAVIATTKFCKDCRHFVHSTHSATYAECAKTGYADLVTGKTKRRYCSTERESMKQSDCGYSARHFEPIVRR